MDYSTKEIAEILKVTDRSVRRYLSTYFKYEKGKITISEKFLKILKNEHNRTDEDTNTEYDIVEGFTEEEYAEFQKRLIEYPILKEQVEYHKKSVERHQQQVEKILGVLEKQNNILEQKNYIEAKKLDH